MKWVVLLCLSVLIFANPNFSWSDTRLAFNALSGRFLPIWVAKDAGLFERYQLNVPLVYVGGPLAAPTLAAGEVEYAVMGGSTALSGIAAGMDLLLLASMIDEPDLFIATRAGVNEPKHLKGLHVGVGRFGGEPDFLLRYSLKKWGLVPDREVRISQLFGSHPERMAAVVHGRVDGAVISPPATLQAVKVGLDLIQLKEPRDHYLGVTLVARRHSIMKSEDSVRRFVRAFVDGIRLAKSDKPRAVAALRKYTGLNDSHVLSESVNFYSRLLKSNPRVSSESVRLMSEMMGKSFDIQRLIDNRFVDATY